MSEKALLLTPVIGYKGLVVKGSRNHPSLVSAADNSVWLPHEETEFACAVHASPQKHSRCGIYAFKGEMPRKELIQSAIVAKIEMWGNLVEHEKGYRSQYARIIGFAGGTVDYETALKLSKIYDVPLLEAPTGTGAYRPMPISAQAFAIAFMMLMAWSLFPLSALTALFSSRWDSALALLLSAVFLYFVARKGISLYGECAPRNPFMALAKRLTS